MKPNSSPFIIYSYLVNILLLLVFSTSSSFALENENMDCDNKLFSLHTNQDISLLDIVNELVDTCQLNSVYNKDIENILQNTNIELGIKNKSLSEVFEILFSSINIDTVLYDKVLIIYKSKAESINYKDVPKLWEFWGRRIAKFDYQCNNIKKDKRIPRNIKNKCKKLHKSIQRAFKFGRNLDNVPSQKSDIDSTDKYHNLLTHIDSQIETIKNDIYSEMDRAIKTTNISYHKFLVELNAVQLYESQISFMKTYIESFKGKDVYIKYYTWLEQQKQQVEAKKEEEKQQVEAKKEEGKKQQKEHAKQLFLEGVRTTDKTASEQKLKEACRLGSVDACIHLAAVFYLPKRDYKNYYNFTEKACLLGSPESCSVMVDFYKTKGNLSKAREYDRLAKKFALQECNAGKGRGCYLLAERYMPNPKCKDTGYCIDTEQDIGYALKLYWKACQINDYFACGELIEIYEEGRYARANEDTLFELYKKDCSINNITNLNCQKAGLIFYKRKNYDKALEYLTRECYDLFGNDGCYVAGLIYAVGKGGIEQDPEKAKQYFKIGCEHERYIQNRVRSQFVHKNCKILQRITK